MNEEIKLIFEAARDTTKQAITLATSVLVVLIAFAKNFIEFTQVDPLVFPSGIGILFLFSIAFGLYTLMELTGEISKLSERKTKIIFPRGGNNIPSIWTKRIVWASRIQMGAFFAGLVCTVFAAIFNSVNLDFIYGKP